MKQRGKSDMDPEKEARQRIDDLLRQAGWAVQDSDSVNLYASQEVAVREFRLKAGHGQTDDLSYVDRRAAGVVEAKPMGFALTGVEWQAEKYGDGLPDDLPAWLRPLPFEYQSTGVETRFTNGLDPTAGAARFSPSTGQRPWRNGWPTAPVHRISRPIIAKSR